MSRKRIPSVGKSLISRIFARSAATSMTGLDDTRNVPHEATRKRFVSSAATLSIDNHGLPKAGSALVEEGLYRLPRLVRRVGLGEGVDAVCDGGRQIRVAP